MTDKVQKIRKEVERIQLYTQSGMLKQILDFIDSLQEEPSIPEIVDEHYWEMLGEEPVSEQNLSNVQRTIKNWKEEPLSEDLGEYINELSKQFPEVSFAKLSRIAVRVAKWKEKQMMKDAIIVEAHEKYGELWGDIRKCNTEEGKKYKVIIIKEE